ncbi:MAG: Fic family protein [Patescibacteria group bacterium]|nr:Fic family protein [Patescibacteria group bacterium]
MNLAHRLQKRLLFNQKTAEQVYSMLAKIDAIKGQWKLSCKLSPQIITRLKTSVLITSTGASTRIEGSKLTNDEVKKFLSKLRIKKFKTRDEQEVAGYLELLKKVFDSWRSIAFSESAILSFHKELLKYSEKDIKHRGKYKFGQNRVEARDNKGNLIGIVFEPTQPYLVPKEMQELAEWAKEQLKNKKHPLLIIANFLFEFLAIHPFQDGNGRISRILTNFLLLKSGYEYAPYVSHEKLIEDNKVDYYLALNKAQQTWKTKKEDSSPWILFFLKIVLKQSELALLILTQETVEEFLSEKQTQVWEFALSKEIFQRADAIKATKLKSRTVEQAIKKLLDMNKLVKIGQGKATRYKIKN